MVGEMIFASVCFRFNLNCSKPLTDSSDYDFIVDNKKKLFKVQVKTISCTKNQGKGRKELWVLNISENIDKYLLYCDIIAVYIEPFDTFYLLDLNKLERKSHYTFYPDKKDSRGVLEMYKDNWSIFS